jgi:hypothetical protein
MNAITVEPQRPDVVVHLAEGPQDDLALTARVVEALERAGHGPTADAFASIAEECATTDDLQLLVRCTVTVL